MPFHTTEEIVAMPSTHLLFWQSLIVPLCHLGFFLKKMRRIFFYHRNRRHWLTKGTTPPAQRFEPMNLLRLHRTIDDIELQSWAVPWPTKEQAYPWSMSFTACISPNEECHPELWTHKKPQYWRVTLGYIQTGTLPKSPTLVSYLSREREEPLKNPLKPPNSVTHLISKCTPMTIRFQLL